MTNKNTKSLLQVQVLTLHQVRLALSKAIMRHPFAFMLVAAGGSLTAALSLVGFEHILRLARTIITRSV